MKTRTGKGLLSGVEKRRDWFVYILVCGDGTFYTGMTNDMARRFKEHCDGKASRYTRARKPVRVVYEERCRDRSRALKREFAVKALSRDEKACLIRSARTGKDKTGGIGAFRI